MMKIWMDVGFFLVLRDKYDQVFVRLCLHPQCNGCFVCAEQL